MDGHKKPACQMHLVQVFRTVYFGRGTKASGDRAVLADVEKKTIIHNLPDSLKSEFPFLFLGTGLVFFFTF